MSKTVSGTNGGVSGTSLRIGWRAWGMIFALLCLSNAVNVTSAFWVPVAQRHFDMWEVVVWEGSSAIILILLAPVFYAAYARWPRERLGIWRFIGLHLGLFLLFSLLHVAGMVAVRKLAYAVMGSAYDFTNRHPLVTFLYEARKDSLTYLIFLALFWIDQRLRVRPVPAEKSLERLEVRTDGRTVFVAPTDILFIEAAGNYVELHQASSKPLLLRGTLSEWEKRLDDRDFVRIHRSRLVNRAQIGSFAATPSGDLKIVMCDGREIAGSRRYRDNL